MELPDLANIFSPPFATKTDDHSPIAVCKKIVMKIGLEKWSARFTLAKADARYKTEHDANVRRQLELAPGDLLHVDQRPIRVRAAEDSQTINFRAN